MTLLRLRSSINPVGFAVSHSADSLSPASFLELPLNTFCIISYHLSRHNKGRRTSAHARQKQRNECFEKKTTSGFSSAGLTLMLQTAQYSWPLLIKLTNEKRGKKTGKEKKQGWQVLTLQPGITPKNSHPSPNQIAWTSNK